MAQCANCGAPLAPDARFCSKCGTPVAVQAPIATSPPPQPVVTERAHPATVAPPQRSTWWILPGVIVGLVVIAWLVLAGLPFGGEKRVVATETSETIAEGTANVPPEPTGTVVDLGTDERFPTQTIEAPPLTQTTSTQAIPTQSTPIRTVPPVTQSQPAIQPAPVIVEDQPVPREAIPAPPRPIPRPAPRQTPEPEPSQEETRDEITEAEASSALRSQLASANPYDGVSQSCLQLRSLGYRNVGYTFAVWDACVEGGGARMLGRWRVDAKTREVFRQGDDGRYH